jgi:arylsulfatase A-like enzyme
LPDTPEVRRDVADLNAKIRAIDRGVAETVEALNRAGLAENTVLVFTTDHGIAFPRSKATLFEPGVGTAMIARGPGLPAGRVVDRLTSHMDLMPTFLEMAGVEPPQGIEGRSLMPLLYDPATPWRDALFLEMTFHSAYDPMRGCVTDRYKYVRSYETDKFMLPANVDQGPTKGVFLARGEHLRPRPAEMLFDLLEDPTENENLACCPSSEDVLAHMRRRVDAWLRDRDDPIQDGSYPQPAGTSVTPRDSLVPNPAA